MIVGFAGMTHLGINTAVATADKGWEIIGYDENQKTIDNLKNKVLEIPSTVSNKN